MTRRDLPNGSECFVEGSSVLFVMKWWYVGLADSLERHVGCDGIRKEFGCRSAWLWLAPVGRDWTWQKGFMFCGWLCAMHSVISQFVSCTNMNHCKHNFNRYTRFHFVADMNYFLVLLSTITPLFEQGFKWLQSGR